MRDPREREWMLTRLGSLRLESYELYLKSPHWKRLKSRYRTSAQPQDCMCGETKNVQLHHLTYERLGEEQLSDLTPLCPPCHSMIHVLEQRGDIGLDFRGFICERRAARYQPERDRQAKERAEWESERAHELWHKRTQSLRSSIRQTTHRMMKDERDPVPMLNQLERIIMEVERRFA